MIEKNGTYTAVIAKPARLIKSSKDTHGVEVVFDFPEIEDQPSLTWVGWLSEKARENTFKTLSKVLDSDGSDQLDEDGYFTSEGFVNREKKYSLVVEMEDVLDQDGNHKFKEETGEVLTRPRIKWVNNLGGSNYEGVKPVEAKTFLSQINFKGAIKAKSTAKSAPAAKQDPPPIFENKGDKLPF